VEKTNPTDKPLRARSIESFEEFEVVGNRRIKTMYRYFSGKQNNLKNA
jgi:hypothetical protein